jgi:DeoR/GlpR family transcriptional regulator of sugar metabolism
MVGPMALAGIAAVRLDTVVLGCCGVSPEGHVMAHDLGDAAVKQALLASARRSVLAVDGAKFGRGALAVVRELSRFDVVVTDATAPEPLLAALRADGVDVHRA